MSCSAAGHTPFLVPQRLALTAGARSHNDLTLGEPLHQGAKEVRIMRDKSVLLRTLVAASRAKPAGIGVARYGR